VGQAISEHRISAWGAWKNERNSINQNVGPYGMSPGAPEVRFWAHSIARRELKFLEYFQTSGPEYHEWLDKVQIAVTLNGVLLAQLVNGFGSGSGIVVTGSNMFRANLPVTLKALSRTTIK
jgi:hypothetical protein